MRIDHYFGNGGQLQFIQSSCSRVASVILRELRYPLNQHIVGEMGIPEGNSAIGLLIHHKNLAAVPVFRE